MESGDPIFREDSSTGRKQRDLYELAAALGLILIVIWTPPPWQSLLSAIAAATIVALLCNSFREKQPTSQPSPKFLRSLWVVGLASILSAMAFILASEFHTLHLPEPPQTGFIRWGGLPVNSAVFIDHYGLYVVWASIQQLLLQYFSLTRLLRLLPNATSAAAAAAVLFAVVHLPNPVLTLLTLFCGFAACLLYLKYRNLYVMAAAHAMLGISVAITVPNQITHNMRVGLGYLTYVQTQQAANSPQPNSPRPNLP